MRHQNYAQWVKYQADGGMAAYLITTRNPTALRMQMILNNAVALLFIHEVIIF